MKVKNLEIGLRVQVKAKNHSGFFEASAGKFGTIVGIDDGSHLDVKIKYDDGVFEWGNHKGIKRFKTEPNSIKVGTRVRLVENYMCGFLEGDVGTVKYIESADSVVVHFDVARHGWGSEEYGIPDNHGLWVDPDLLEIITD